MPTRTLATILDQAANRVNVCAVAHQMWRGLMCLQKRGSILTNPPCWLIAADVKKVFLILFLPAIKRVNIKVKPSSWSRREGSEITPLKGRERYGRIVNE